MNPRRRYLNEVEAALSCPKGVKRAVLRKIKDDVDAFFLEHPGASMKELEETLGTPEVFAEEFLASLDTEQVQDMLRHARTRKRIVIGLCCALVVLLLAAVVVVVKVVYSETKSGVETVVVTVAENDKNATSRTTIEETL